MNKESVLGVLRHILTFGGGLAVAQGHIDEASMMELVGAVITIAGVTWSILQKKSQGKSA
jgi:hypothetical protein